MPQLFKILPLPGLLSLLLAGQAGAATTEVSTPMMVRFTDPASQQVQTSTSNTVTLDIQQKTDEGEVAALVEQLALSLAASQQQAETGDLITYTLKFTNHTGAKVSAFRIDNTLPAGIKLVDGSARLDGERFLGVSTTDHSQIAFVMQGVEADATHTLVYVARVAASAAQGEVVSHAQASGVLESGVEVVSPAVQASMEIRNDGVLSDDGILFGKVSFPVECLPEKKQADGLLPVGGVRIYLEDGRYAITDATGDFNFHAVKPGMHTVKLDSLTLPQGVKPQVTSNQQVGDASSHFAEMPKGGFRRVDFGLECPQQDASKVFALVKMFNDKLLDTDVFEEGERKVSPDFIGPLLSDEAAVQAAVAAKPQATQLQARDALKGITQEQASQGTWLWPKNSISVDGRFMAALPLGAKPVLYLNGEEIPETQLGEQLGDSKKQAQVASWYGIQLDKGDNTLEIRDGKTVLLKQTFAHPMRGATLEITPQAYELPADGGASKLPFKVRVLDENGNLAAGDYFLTLEASDGKWAEPDIQDQKPGHQVKITGGEGVVHLRSSYQTGKVRIRMTSEQMMDETDIAQVVYMRPLIATGYLDVSLHGGDLTDDKLGGEGKVFMKGKIKGGLHLTLAYDSHKDNDDAYSYLHEEESDDYAPARGDGSVRDQEARSRDKLYVKLEKGQNSVMYGDYELDSTTASTASSLDLARDPRYMTGVHAHYGDRETEVDVFAAQQENRRFVELVPGNGTSMNFRVGNGDIIPNTAVVELIVRDRNNPGLTVSTTTLERLTDYTLDEVSGDLTFHRVIPTFDDDLNPVYLRISYDREDAAGEQDYLVSGVRIKRAVTEAVTVGGSYTKDDHPEDGYTLSGAYVDYQPDKDTRVSVSGAQMEHADGDESGNAWRVSARHKWSDKAQTSMTYGQADAGFTNSGSGIAADRREARLDHTHKLGKDADLKLEGIHNENISSEVIHQSIGGRVETRAGDWRVSGGLRHVEHQYSEDESTARNTALVAAKRNIKLFGRGGRVRAEYEQDIQDSSFNHTSADAELLVGKDSSIYGKYDSGNDILGATGLTDEQRRTVLTAGVKTKVRKDTELYSEYRSEGLFSDEDALNAETATGLKGQYEIEPGLNLSPALEVVRVSSGDALENATAASLAISDTRDENNRKYLKVEGRNGGQRDYYGLKGTYVSKLDEDWTAVARDELRVESSATGKTTSNSLTLGAAHRPAGDGRLNSQYSYQWKSDRADGSSNDRDTHVLSTWQHYRVSNKASVSGRLAGKAQTQELLGDSFKTRAGLVDASLNVALTDKLDAELHGGVLGTQGGERSYSAGVGLNMNVTENWRVGAGYNFQGFEDKDLDSAKRNTEGAYIRLQTKIGEDMFKAIQAQESPLSNDRLLE